MTGIDCLREEMEKRGCSKTQIDSKVVAVVLDIISQSGNKYTDMFESEYRESKRLCELKQEISLATVALARAKNELRGLESKRNAVIKQVEEANKYIEAFNRSLTDCETEQGRDAMRRAQVFINSVSVNTAYDNTAYIVSLGAILSDGKIGLLDELRKINPKFLDRKW